MVIDRRRVPGSFRRAYLAFLLFFRAGEERNRTFPFGEPPTFCSNRPSEFPPPPQVLLCFPSLTLEDLGRQKEQSSLGEAGDVHRRWYFLPPPSFSSKGKTGRGDPAFLELGTPFQRHRGTPLV